MYLPELKKGTYRLKGTQDETQKGVKEESQRFSRQIYVNVVVVD